MTRLLIILFIFSSAICMTNINGNDLDSLQNIISQLEGREKVDFLNSLASANNNSGSNKEVIFAQQALEFSEELSYSLGIVTALKNLGDLNSSKEVTKLALSQYLRALEISKKIKDRFLIAELNFKIGRVYEQLNDFSNSNKYFLSALEDYKYLRDDKNIFLTLANIAGVLTERGKYESAKEYFLSAIDKNLIGIDPALEADLYCDFGSMYFKWGNLDKALDYHQKCLTIRHEIKDDAKIVVSLNSIGLIYSAWKKFDIAENFFTKARSISENANLQKGKAYSLVNTAKLSQQKGNFEEAQSNFDKALNIFEELNEPTGVQYALIGYGNLLKEMGKNYQALRYYKRLLSISEARNDNSTIALALHKIGVIYKSTNSVVQAVQNFNKSIEIAKVENNKDLLLENYKEISESSELMGNIDDALKYSRLYSDMKDSIVNEISMSRMAEVKSNLAMLKRKREIESLQQNNLVQSLELESQSKQRNFLFFVTVVVILISSFVYYRYFIKSKTNEVIMAQKNKLDLLNKELNRKNTYLTESESKLKYLNGTKDKFFSIISHDLKNPFSTLMGYSDLLSEYFDDFSSEEKKSIISEIQNSTHRAYSLLENLLQWSKSQRGELQMLPERIDLSIIVSDTLTNLNEDAHKKNISLISEICEQTYALADYTTLASVVKNLISNSIKFTNEGGEVKISAQEKGELIEVNVSDNGVSISEEDIDKLFRIDVHHTTIGVAAEKGTGLGLVLCKEFVEKNGGKIWVESESGKGSEFKFTIPKYNV
jgi:signal transduction histidine kinase